MKRHSAFTSALCALFAALITVGAYIRIPGPLIPFTLQVTFVILSGWTLGAKYGMASVLLYIFSGLMGIPVFTAGGGPGYVLNPNFGYIIGFAPGAAVTGILSRRIKPSYTRLLLSGLAGTAVIYAVGTVYFFLINELYLGVHIGIKKLLTGCILLTAPTDILLTFVSAEAAKRILPAIKRKNI